MKTNAELDKWSAEKCGVRRAREDCYKWYYPAWWPTPKGSIGCHERSEWTLSDARCRAVFWEWWLMNNKGYTKMVRTDLDAYVVVVQKGTDITTSLNGYKKSLESAEIACIQAIKDAEGK